jgi:hypothetical protein
VFPTERLSGCGLKVMAFPSVGSGIGILYPDDPRPGQTLP